MFFWRKLKNSVTQTTHQIRQKTSELTVLVVLLGLLFGWVSLGQSFRPNLPGQPSNKVAGLSVEHPSSAKISFGPAVDQLLSAEPGQSAVQSSENSKTPFFSTAKEIFDLSDLAITTADLYRLGVDVFKNGSSPLAALANSKLSRLGQNRNKTFLPDPGITNYTVQRGDTLSRIASRFNVSANTIFWENQISNRGLIKAGQKLRILPISGLRYTVKEGETLAGVAEKYNLQIEQLLEHNQIEIAKLIIAGDQIIIPDNVKVDEQTVERQKYLASLTRESYRQIKVPEDYQSPSKFFTWPLPAGKKISQSFFRWHPGVDIPCHSCSVVASADGIVESSGWRKNYGYSVVINHGNGIKTLYAHGNSIIAFAGQLVKQGQTVMLSGNTGRASGQHLHFEIIIREQQFNPLIFLSNR